MDTDDFEKDIPTCEGLVEKKCEEEIAYVVDMAMIRSEHWNQMVDSYDDPEIVTKALHEKEKDLELAARIGKALLQRNDDLEKRNEILEDQIGQASEQVTQLKHELQKKSELLRVFTTDNEFGEGSGDFKRTPERSSCGQLQRRVRQLEEENTALKLDISQLKAITIVLKEKEEQIVGEFLRKIAETKRHTKAVCAEWQEKQDECDAKENKIKCLTKEIAEKLKNEHKLKEENEILVSKLQVVQGLQADLAQELLDLQDRYSEVLAMLAGAKQELKDAQEKLAEARFSRRSIADDSTYDSLASELEASDSGYSVSYGSRQQSHSTPNMNTSNDQPKLDVRIPEIQYDNDEASLEEPHRLAIEDHTPDDTIFDPVESDSEASERAKLIMRSIEAALAMPNLVKRPVFRYANGRVGVPGTPGSKDLELAIERLSQKRGPEFETKRSTDDQHSDETASQDSENCSVKPKKTPPNRAKLMLVVPVEGSKALEHWKRLATPSGIDSRSWEKAPGINVKTGFELTKSPQMPTLSKRFAVSSLLASLPIPASTYDQSKLDTAAPLMSSFSLNRIPEVVQKSTSNIHEPKPGPSLTERCMGLLNSWLSPGDQNSLEKSKSSAAINTVKNEKPRRDSNEYGLLGCFDDSEPSYSGNGVMVRVGLNMSK